MFEGLEKPWIDNDAAEDAIVLENNRVQSVNRSDCVAFLSTHVSKQQEAAG